MGKHKAALYVRVSTHHQIDRDSLPYQRQELINYCKYVLGIDDYEIFEDAGYSAKNTDRPQFQEMMARIRNGEFTHLLVWKIDRISRNLKDFTEMYDELKQCDITFISKNEQFDTGTAMGEAMIQIILVFAELERKLTAERVMGIMLSRAEKGLWNGAPVAYGYEWCEEKQYPVIRPEEAAVVQFIFDAYEETRSSIKVANLLEKKGIKTKRGGVWGSKGVVDIIRNPFHKGTYRYNYRESARGPIKDESEWIVHEAFHEAIVSEEQWERCNKIMDANSTRNTADLRKNVGIHVFAGLIKCGRCGASFSASYDTARKDGYRPSIYRCKSVATSKGCDNRMISDITLGPFVINYIANLLKAQEALSKKDSLRSFENLLLKGKPFKDIAGIERQGLEQTYLATVYGGLDKVTYEQPQYNDTTATTLEPELELLKREKKKHERAGERLQNLYLYSDDSMSEKDYLLKKKEITDAIEIINEKIWELHERESNQISINDLSFLQKASYFYLSNELLRTRMINYKTMITTIDNQLVKDFVNTVISKICVDDRRITSITFKNGITHKFVYKK